MDVFRSLAFTVVIFRSGKRISIEFCDVGDSLEARYTDHVSRSPLGKVGFRCGIEVLRMIGIGAS